MESMQRIIKQITNDIIDLKKNKGEGKRPFNPFMKKITNFVPQIPPTSGINIQELASNLPRVHKLFHCNAYPTRASEKGEKE